MGPVVQALLYSFSDEKPTFCFDVLYSLSELAVTDFSFGALRLEAGSWAGGGRRAGGAGTVTALGRQTLYKSFQV